MVTVHFPEAQCQKMGQLQQQRTVKGQYVGQ